VDKDAPAGKAGLREHDVILEFNGTAVESEEQIRRLIRETPPGRTVTLGISREGVPMKITAQLADHGQVVAKAWPRAPIARMPSFPRNSIDIPNIQVQIYSAALGVQTENLTRQLGEFFGVKDGEGILIRSVEKGGAAEKAGLKAGDVIVRADNEKLADGTDLSHVLRNHRSGGKVNLVVVRDKHEQPFVVTLPDRGSRDSSMLDFDGLDFDGEALLAPLHNIDAMIAELDTRGLDSLHGKLALLDGDLEKLELSATDHAFLEITPEAEKAMRDAERQIERTNRLLQDLPKLSNPI
jgi:membrane-associated protease RseP (regulator of RpoE activity)